MSAQIANRTSGSWLAGQKRKLKQRRGVVGGSLMVTLALLLALPAMAFGAEWKVSPTPNPKGSTRIYGASCTSSVACTTVSGSGTTNVLSAESWNGSEWVVRSLPVPAGSLSGRPYDISCSSASFCVAVGSYLNSVELPNSLLDVWNGTEWKNVAVPLPKEIPNGVGANSLKSVSCTSATACTAVGFYNMKTQGSPNHYGILVETWNGSTWTVGSAGLPGTTSLFEVESISCTSATACTIVGKDYVNATSQYRPFAMRLSGSVWSVQSVPSPPGYPGAGATGVSCTSATACTMVGATIGTQTPFAERWNGTTWSNQTTPLPSGSTTGALRSVSCVSATRCTAAGTATAGSSKSLVDQWNGTEWKVQTTPNWNSSTLLDDISCASESMCMSVGTTRTEETAPWLTFAMVYS